MARFDRRRGMASALFLAALLGAAAMPQPAAAQSWFPAGHVQCSLSSPMLNLGIFSRISDPAPAAESSFNVSCSSNAYPEGYPSTYRTAEGGYCLTISGARVLKGQGKNANISIPFNFYNSTRKTPDPNRPQDFTTPIGDGTYGIAFFDWDYHDGVIWRLPPPWAGGPMIAIPVHSYFRMQVSPSASGAYPAGVYSGNFTFNWVAGEVKKAGTFPKVTEGPAVCNEWQGERGSGAVNVTLEIKKYCNISVKQNIAFGPQAFLNKLLTQEGAVSADCSEGTLFAVGINDGLNSKLAAGHRAMKIKGGDDLILYDLYKDSARTERWGNDWGNDTAIKRGTGSAQGQDFPVYAAVPPQSNKPAGDYSDTVVVQVKIMDPGG